MLPGPWLLLQFRDIILLWISYRVLELEPQPGLPPAPLLPDRSSSLHSKGVICSSTVSGSPFLTPCAQAPWLYTLPPP